MISPNQFLDILLKKGVTAFYGVPDSLLSPFCSVLSSPGFSGAHLIAPNEGNAIALAIGYHLGTGRVAAVYLQNSGLGNAINPLVSLADPTVYKIPVLLIIGWRGEPGQVDEPQHQTQGQITQRQLDILGIKYFTMDAGSDVVSLIDMALQHINFHGCAVALLVKKNSFLDLDHPINPSPKLSELTREAAIDVILGCANCDDLIVSTTGKTSRELFELRANRTEAQSDFLTVGGMGHCSSIALGLAMANPQKKVICLDGDGAFLMHMGIAATIGASKQGNFHHILLNNGAHESVGGQPTVAKNIDFIQLANACGYQKSVQADSLCSLGRALLEIFSSAGPSFLEIRLKLGSRKNLGRPTSTPLENKQAFMSKVGIRN